MDQYKKKQIDDALGLARSLEKEIESEDGDASDRLAAEASEAIDTTTAAVAEADAMDKRHKKIVADEAGVASRAGDVAASRISPFGPGSPEGFQDERRSARDAVAAAMVSDARNRVMAEKGDSLRAKATAAAEACKALARGIEREEMLALGVGDALGDAPSADEVSAEDRLLAELSTRTGAEVLKLFSCAKDLGDVEKTVRFERAALRLATERRSTMRKAPRPSPGELSELGAIDVLIAAVEASRRERMPRSIEVARNVLAILKDKVFSPVFAFDARVASRQVMDELRSRPAALAAATQPFSLAPDLANRVMP